MTPIGVSDPTTLREPPDPPEPAAVAVAGPDDLPAAIAVTMLPGPHGRVRAAHRSGRLRLGDVAVAAVTLAGPDLGIVLKTHGASAPKVAELLIGGVPQAPIGRAGQELNVDLQQWLDPHWLRGDCSDRNGLRSCSDAAAR